MRNKEKHITIERERERGRQKDKTQFQDNFHGATRKSLRSIEPYSSRSPVKIVPELCFSLPPFSLSLSVLERPRLPSHSHFTKDSLHHIVVHAAHYHRPRHPYLASIGISTKIFDLQKTSIISYLQVCCREIDITKEESYMIGRCNIHINSIWIPIAVFSINLSSTAFYEFFLRCLLRMTVRYYQSGSRDSTVSTSIVATSHTSFTLLFLRFLISVVGKYYFAEKKKKKIHHHFSRLP